MNDSGRRNGEEYVGSIFFGEVRVGESFEDDMNISKEKVDVETKGVHGEANKNEYVGGNKSTSNTVINVKCQCEVKKNGSDC